METKLVERTGLPFKTIPAAGIHGVGAKALPGNLVRLGHGFWAARQILDKFKPDLLFFTGGYVAVPMALTKGHIPTMLYVPDIEPGLALKFLSHFADRIAITTEDSFRYFKRRERVVLTGYPTRPNLANWSRSDARRAMNLTSKGTVLLVLGGSKGTRSINNAVLANLPSLLEMAQVIHITGELDWPNVERECRSMSKIQAMRYHTFPYLHEEMGAALTAADLAISRAGASVLGEYPQFGLPAILIPYPHAWNYQNVNADYLTRRGAALKIEDAQLSEIFLPTVKKLLENPSQLNSMRDAMQRLYNPQAAAEIGRQMLALAGERR